MDFLRSRQFGQTKTYMNIIQNSTEIFFPERNALGKNSTHTEPLPFGWGYADWLIHRNASG
jgi:hypothetical protein